VAICSEADDVMLTTAQGQCIRFPVTEVRVFKGRDSTGVRGIMLAEGDRVIALGILHHLDASAEERAAFLKARRAAAGEPAEEGAVEGIEGEDMAAEAALTPERLAEMQAREQIVLTVSENGYGKRSSSYEYRVTGRGGKGIVAMVTNDRNGPLIASFPVDDTDQIMLVTDGGQLIRVPVGGIRVAGRATQGVIVFDTAEGERVVSVEHISDDGEEAEA
jgi:DNA gyrase subunit A